MTRTTNRAILDSSSPDTRQRNPHLFGKAKPVEAAPFEAPFEAPPKRSRKQPNQTEADYRARHIDGRDDVAWCRFEGVTLRVVDGQFRYTPDWVVMTTAGVIECHECKGIGKAGFRHPSHGRSKMAFTAAALQWPFRFVWAERRGGVWTVRTATGTEQ